MKSWMITLGMVVSLMTSVASASIVIDSGDNENPDVLGTFNVGETIIRGSVVNALGGTSGFPPADVDVFTFTVAAGTELAGITLTNFLSTDDVGFAAIAEGTTFPFNAVELSTGPDTTQFLGGTLFGTGNPGIGAQGIGSDILAAFAATEAGGTGFDAPLSAGDYTIYIQQLGTAFISYELTFDVAPVPLPAAVWMFGAGLMGLVGWSKRKQAA